MTNRQEIQAEKIESRTRDIQWTIITENNSHKIPRNTLLILGQGEIRYFGVFHQYYKSKAYFFIDGGSREQPRVVEKWSHVPLETHTNWPLTTNEIIAAHKFMIERLQGFPSND